MLTEKDLSQLAERHVTPEQANAQLERFKTGFPMLRLLGSARPGNGILVLDHERQTQALDRWQQYLAEGGQSCKFVPASGAASRMFKAMFEFADGQEPMPAAGSAADEVIRNIRCFAFFGDLDAACRRIYGKDVDALIAEGCGREVISAIIKAEGLNYGQLPKGLLLFHDYTEGPRTPIDEQIAEGACSAAIEGGSLKLHFTVSPAHRELFMQKLADAVPAAEKKFGMKIDVSLSEQKASTDTIAANPDGTPFRQADGSLLFRPGGHGALIENLNDIDTAVVFVKNIDNVVPDHFREATLLYKKVLAGYLIMAHDRIAAFLAAIASGAATDETLRQSVEFMKSTLCIHDPRLDSLKGAELARLIAEKLNRPLRVCGMVRNEGEPGGGPYIAYNADGSASPQILESNQIDKSNPEYMAMMTQATHFNPVDLVCYIKDPAGKNYNLTDYVDANTGFISQKSSQGRELLAMELPGLWNGAMSDWNTIFIEVPVATFNPVKTINDLLRPTHQPSK